MNHAVNSDQYGYEYAEVQRNKARAIIALAKMPVKDTKHMKPMDYSLKYVTNEKLREFRERECTATKENLNLRERCIYILRKGPQTTAEIARALRVSSRAVGIALRGVQNIKEEQIHERSQKKAGAYVDGIRWTLPTGAAKAGAA